MVVIKKSYAAQNEVNLLFMIFSVKNELTAYWPIHWYTHSCKYVFLGVALIYNLKNKKVNSISGLRIAWHLYVTTDCDNEHKIYIFFLSRKKPI